MNQKNKQEILSEIAELSKQCGSTIDAIVEICEVNNIEIETVSQFIKSSKDMKEKVRQEGLVLNMLKE